MKITSFGFVDLAESFIKDALSSPPLGGGSWGFQRSVNFSERTGSLQIVLKNASGVAKTKASIQARQTGTSKDYSIQGWTELPDEDKRSMFVLKESNPVRVEEEIFEIVDRLRDQSATFERPAPPPKPTFAPLIPEIQNAPAEPSAESFDSNQAFIDSLLSGDKENPAEAEPAAESAESNQALVDSLLSTDKSDQPPAEEEPASAPATEAPADEAAAPEEAAPKAKATKPKKAAK
jgi:hypothetical protein